jgi:hypothetical protein
VSAASSGSDPRPIVCFGGEDWWYHPHGHMDIQLMKRFAEHRDVLYINSIGVHMPSVKQGSDFVKKLKNKVRSLRRGMKQVGPRMWVYTPPALPMYDKRWGRFVHYRLIRRGLAKQLRQLGWDRPIYWITTPTAEARARRDAPATSTRPARLPAVGRLRGVRLLDHAARVRAGLRGSPAAAGRSGDLPQRRSAREGDGGRRSSHALPHGIDERWLDAPMERPPNDRSVIGYAGGATTYKIDAELLRRLGAEFPDAELRFIGRPELDLSSQLEDVSNINWVGQLPYDELPEQIVAFDVAINPAPINEWTRGANPLKFKEYLAARSVDSDDRPAGCASLPGSRHRAEPRCVR